MYRDNIEPLPWFGFDHDKYTGPLINSISDYALVRCWALPWVGSPTSNEALALASEEDFAICQSMLFFGTWECFLQRRLTAADFISTTNGPTLDTSALRPTLSALYWSIRRQETGFENETLGNKAQQWYQIRMDLLEWRNKLGAGLSSPFISSKYITILLRQVVLTLDMIILVRDALPQHIRQTWPRMRVAYEPYSALLKEKLEKLSWCSSIYSRLERLGVSGIEYLSVLGPRKTFGSRDHSQCGDRVCSVANIVSTQFKAHHAKDNCSCSQAKLPIHAMRNVLQSGGYCVIDQARLIDLKYSPESAVVPYQSGLNYVAISHVWSHGLGGPADDGLPLCSFNQICQIMETSVLRGKKLWMDTLCIPTDYELKMKSISVMDQVYRNAAAVLVIDHNIRTIPFGDTPIETIAIEIVIADWNSRLWTLQEALLADKLYFVFKDGIFSLDVITNRLKCAIEDCPTILNLSCMDLIATLESKTYQNSLFDVCRALEGRTSSVLSDECLVLSTIMGLPIPIAATNSVMSGCAHFWKAMRNVPKDILFSQVERLSEEGFRWAPKTFMIPGTYIGFKPNSQRDSEVTDCGLRTTLIIIKLPCLASLQWLKDKPKNWKKLQLCNISIQLRAEFENISGFRDFDAIALQRCPRADSREIRSIALLHQSFTSEKVPQFQYRGRLQVHDTEDLDHLELSGAERTVLIV